MNILKELDWRGLVADCTDRTEFEKRATSPLTLYCGFDPTADSLHAGNLVPLLGLRRFQLLGHHPIAVAGGATGSIGDPSGKTAERQLLTKETIATNIASVKEQLRRLLDFDTKTNPARLVDNASWTANVSFLDFLRDIGKHFSVNQMIGKESVRARMEDREVGISYTEFSYMLLQAFDFYVLCRDYQCELQIGGSDQWGNITAGIDLCRKKLGKQVYGLTMPLITNADGTKFGKTEAGAVWLDARKTSVYKFYQFWIRTDDRDVIRYLNYFTLLPREEIQALERQHAEKPELRVAHKALAKAVTDLVHGSESTKQAQKASSVLFGGLLNGVEEATFNELLETDDFDEAKFKIQEALLDNVGQIPRTTVELTRFGGPGASLLELVVCAGLSSSKGQARKDIEAGGIYINNIRETDPQKRITWNELLYGKHLLLRKGKRNYVVVTVVTAK